jgi:hypothetical protein
VLAQRETALEVEREPIGARFAPGERCGTGIAAAFQEARDALVGMPLHDDVARDVGEQQRFALVVPQRSLGPHQVVGEPVDLRVGRKECVEALVQRLETRVR